MSRGSSDQLAALIEAARKGKPLARADAIKELKKHLKLNANVAQAINRTPQHVEQMLLLAEAPEPVRTFIERGCVTATHATKLLRSERRGGIPAIEAIHAGLAAAQAKGHDRVCPSDVRQVVKTQYKKSIGGVFRRLEKHLKSGGESLVLELKRTEARDLFKVLEGLR